MRIGPSTPYDFAGSNMTAYGGLLPLATMLEKLQFQQLIEEHVTIKRVTSSMPGFRFVLAIVLAPCGIFASQPPAVPATRTYAHRNFGWTGCWYRDLLAFSDVAPPDGGTPSPGGIPAHVATGLGGRSCEIEGGDAGHRYHGADRLRPAHGRPQRIQPEASWEKELSTEPDVCGRKREYISGELRKGESVSGHQISAHLDSVFRALPTGVERSYGGSDSGFYLPGGCAGL